VEIDVKRKADQSGGKKYPRPSIKVIVLSGGTFPVRDSFALGETLEPIRALLSTRQSRSYVDINTAERTVPSVVQEIPVQDTTERITISDFRIAKLGNYYYDLPLGWFMSKRTRDIIQRQSGRYWDCEFTTSFTQAATGNSETDCVQLLIYHELNQSIRNAAIEVATGNHYRQLLTITRPKAAERFSTATKGEIVRCHVDKNDKNDKNDSWTLSQTYILEALLDEWNYYPYLTDDRMLAYVLGTTVYETGDYHVFTETLSYPSAERIHQVFPHIFPNAEAAAPYVSAPEQLANKVYGNRLGNTTDGDGWRFRRRGVFPILGRANYAQQSHLISAELEKDPDLVLNRYIGAGVALAFFFKAQNNRLASYFQDGWSLWEDARKSLPGLPKIPAWPEAVPEGGSKVAAISKNFFECIQKSKFKK